MSSPVPPRRSDRADSDRQDRAEPAGRADRSEHRSARNDRAHADRPGDGAERSGARPRRRDRHGRGMRGPVAPPQVPLAISRAEAFDDLVRDSVSRLERRWPQLAHVEFAVQEVPRIDSGDLEEDADVVPLGRVAEAGDERPDRVVVYRRPVEIRTRNRDERALLVHEVVVEQVAELLGLSPESVDPRYGQE